MEFHGIEKLRGAENWHIWKFAVKNLLRGIEGACEVCTGELLEPELAEQGESPEARAAHETKLKAWDKADRSASQVIVKTVESKLHSVFEQQTKQAAHTVQAEFFSFMKTLTDDIVTHIAKFEGLVLRMQQLNVKTDESSLIVKLLDSLPDEFEGLRQAWWARPESQQTVNNLIEVLTSEEKRRQQRAEKQDDLVALFASKAKMQGKNERGQRSNQNPSTETKKTKEKVKFDRIQGRGIHL
ncbi:hypothetical protein GEV33_000141 [Tenebrio molitor]|uniref:Uncharacterized protein n=1 Tax=Tenebrio molitor TaxID=7067 RepID=A0A8J6LHP9_TENMO|nr:hypothetical protein GEV33_000141 [Tenebrio molitor]